MKDGLKFTLLTIGLIAIFFIMGREIVDTKDKLRNAQDQVVQAKKEKVWLQDALRLTRGEVTKKGRDLKVCRDRLDFVNKKIFALKGRNSTLFRARIDLEAKIALLQEEKMAMEAKFHSLSELKKAIRQVKAEIRDDKIKQRKEQVRQKEEIDKWETALGNKGYLTKDGEEYYKPKVNVEVRPANLSLNKK